jgi:hypothetical protein
MVVAITAAVNETDFKAFDSGSHAKTTRKADQ